jgi:hypothetical protein
MQIPFDKRNVRNPKDRVEGKDPLEDLNGSPPPPGEPAPRTSPT